MSSEIRTLQRRIGFVGVIDAPLILDAIIERQGTTRFVVNPQSRSRQAKACPETYRAAADSKAVFRIKRKRAKAYQDIGKVPERQRTLFEVINFTRTE